MKNTKILRIMMFAFLMTSLFVSCGGDGTDDGENTHVIDGVNVKSGKKLVKLTLLVDDYSNNTEPYDLRIMYDSKNRLSKIIAKNIPFYNDATHEYIKKDYEVAKIDYDLRTIDIANYVRYMFMLNDKGYVSQIGTCSCVYDKEGYLTGVENPTEIWNIVYDSGDIIKSSVSKLVSGKVKIYYYYYGEDSNKGELIFTMNDSNSSSLSFDNSLQALISFIAYQSGLFGKTSKHCNTLSKSNSQAALFSKTDGKKTKSIHCSFVFE